VDDVIFEALAGLPRAEQDAILDLFRRYVVGRALLREVIRRIDGATRGRIAALLERRALRRVFSDDFRGFRDPLLAEGFRRSKVADAVQWATNQKRGRYRAALIQELGDDFIRKINRAFQRGLIPQLKPGSLAAFDRAAARGTEHARELREIVAGHGTLFEVDHLVEQRFLRVPRVADFPIHEDDVFSLVVAKNPAVARLLEGYRGYVHTVKTEMLRRMIPHGAEHGFSVQQWWEAHDYVYRALGVADDPIHLARLRDHFADLAAAAGERIDFTRRAAPATFLPENGWPLVFPLPRRRLAEELVDGEEVPGQEAPAAR
jgi:hypothetical protein